MTRFLGTDVEMTAPQVAVEHYATLEYDTEARWASYWHQLREVLACDPESCLEIGVGSGAVGTYLRARGVHAVAVDIDPALAPDRLGDVRALPCVDGEFDVVLCAQVLEHLPFDEVGAALDEIARVADRRAVVTVPRFGRNWELSFRVPPFRRVSWVGSLPSRHGFAFDGQHYWELGSRNARKRDVFTLLERRFVVTSSYRVPGNPWHHLFVLDRRSDV